MYSLIRPLLFSLPPERAHHITLATLNTLEKLHLAHFLFGTNTASKPQTVMGITFPNALGLAAGLDKNADYVDGLGALGFGFIEVGTITPRPQSGNPQPRLFRLPKKNALINRMGFNNAGVETLIANVKKQQYKGILGINIGKNFDTALENAVDDYVICLEKVYPYADYITVNISSPNTPGLRTLQHGDELNVMLAKLKLTQLALQKQHDRYVSIAVKIAPDMDEDAIYAVANALIEHDIDGVIATNTTLERTAVQGLNHADEQGGLSGAPLTEKSTEVIKQLHTALAGKLPIIAVGGIQSAADAQAKLDAGASLVQIYTGLVYQGPALVKNILRSL